MSCDSNSVRFTSDFRSTDKCIVRPVAGGRFKKKKTGFGSTFLGWKDMATAAAVMFEHRHIQQQQQLENLKEAKK